MQNSMPLPDSGGQNTSSKRKRTPAQPQKWTLLNLLGTWFLSDDGRPLIVDPTAASGASHDDWRELIKRTRVHIAPEQLVQPWGQMARRDFLNWCENNLSVDRRPALFGSKEEALAAWDFSRNFEGDGTESKSASKRIEILKLCPLAPEDDGADPPDTIA